MHRKTRSGTKELITDRSKAVVLMCFSVGCFGVIVSVTFHFMFIDILFSSVGVAEWPPFGKELPRRNDDHGRPWSPGCLMVYHVSSWSTIKYHDKVIVLTMVDHG